MFIQCLPNALHHAAYNLPFDNHRVDDIANIIDSVIFLQADFASVFIDLNISNMGAVREGKVGWVVK